MAGNAHGLLHQYDRAEHAREIDRRLIEPERFPTWIAEGEKSPCGFIEASLPETVPGCMATPAGLIGGWFVAVGYQGRGIGGRLIRAAEDWALEQGAMEIGSVTDTCPVRRAAHLWLGYREVVTEGDTRYFIKELTPVDRVFGVPEPGVEYQQRWGAYAVITDDRGMLAAIRTPKGLFLPGGGMKGPEEYRSCLIREIREEMGCRMELLTGGFIGRAAYCGDSRRVGGPLHTVACFYRSRITEKAGGSTETDHEPVWMDAGEAARRLYLPHQRWAVMRAFGLTDKERDNG